MSEWIFRCRLSLAFLPKELIEKGDAQSPRIECWPIDRSLSCSWRSRWIAFVACCESQHPMPRMLWCRSELDEWWTPREPSHTGGSFWTKSFKFNSSLDWRSQCNRGCLLRWRLAECSSNLSSFRKSSWPSSSRAPSQCL